MISAKSKFLSALLLSGMVALASAQTPAPSSINFKVAGSPNYPILDTGTGTLLNYDLANDRMDFSLGSTGAYDNPFFCFDFSDAESNTVSLNATDANGHKVMDSVGLASELVYDLAGDIISLSPSSSVQCFFKSTETVEFGLFGEESTSSRTTVEGALFADGFAAFSELQVEYESLQINSGDFLDVDGASVFPEDEISYEVVISNIGDAGAEQLSFQEVFPASDAFTAFLSEGEWSCDDNSSQLEVAEFCPLINGFTSGVGALRFQNLSLPPGGELRFTVFRVVQAGSEGSIPLFAGAVSGPGKFASSAASGAVLTVAEAPAGVAFVQQPTNAVVDEPISPAVTIELLDDSGLTLISDNSTPLDLHLWSGDGSSSSRIRQDVTPVNGVYTFDEIIIDAVGQYYLEARVGGLNLLDASQTFEVTQ